MGSFMSSVSQVIVDSVTFLERIKGVVGVFFGSNTTKIVHFRALSDTSP